jgi:pSer/pThr/pTyr-binding forkhead associated (FHA) protein
VSAAGDDDGLPAHLGFGRSRSRGENVLGREPTAAVSIDDATVSRHHARIVIDRGRAVLEDLGSKNGTWLHGSRIATSQALRDGDQIRVGSVPMTFRCFSAERPTETQRT